MNVCGAANVRSGLPDGARLCCRSLLVGMYLFAGAAAAMARAATGQPDLVAPDGPALYARRPQGYRFRCAARLRAPGVLVALLEFTAVRIANAISMSPRSRADFRRRPPARWRPHVQISPGSGRREGFSIPLVFSTRFGIQRPPHAGVVSTARLETNDPSLSRRERAQVLALRAYKLIIDCAGGGVPRRAAPDPRRSKDAR